MKIAICDDEKEFAEDIKRHTKMYFSEHGIEYSLYTFYNSKSILEFNEEFDIAFLDIEIDNVDGISIGKTLQKINPDIVLIYVTAYNHYLDKALDLGITRFFEKPIESQRFYKGLDSAINKIKHNEKKFNLYNEREESETVRSKDIIYVEIIGRKTKVVTMKKEYIAKEKMKFWKENLNPAYFQVPHNSYIINMNHITRYEKSNILMENKYNIPISSNKRSEFKRNFMKFMES